MKTCIASSLIMILFAAEIPAELKWEKEHIRLKAHPLQEVMQGSFSYVNSGSDAIEIVKIDSSCGCLVPQSGKRVVKPGEKGVLDVEFSLRGRSGTQKKYILVSTSANPKVPFRLNIEVDIPDSYLPSIRRVIWERAASYEPQTVRLTNHYHEPILLEEILPSIGTIKATLVPIKPGFEYDLIITPDPGAENLRGFIRLKPKVPAGMKSAKDFKVYVFVK